MWLSDYKKALILQDFETLEALISNMPAFDNINEVEEAAYLIHQTLLLAESEKTSTLIALQQIKNTLDFLKSTESTFPSSLNLKL